MAKFNIGDKIQLPTRPDALIFKVLKVDELTQQVPQYYIERETDGIKIWDYCLGWEKVIESDDVLRYGEVLTDDEFECDILDYTGFQIAETNYYRIRTIRYESRIFYHKMVDGEVVEFKELTV